MKIPIQWFDEILFGRWMPWKNQAVTEVQWGFHLTKIKPREAAFQERYAVEIQKPVNNMTRFYKALIDAQTIAYLNVVHQKMNRAILGDQKAYILFALLERTIPRFFNKLSEVMAIVDASIFQEQLNFSNTQYVFACLRANSSRLFLEIQDTYPEFIKHDHLDEMDLIRQYFFQFENTSLLLKKLELPQIHPTQDNPIKPETSQSFTPIKSDIRGKKPKNVLSYHEAVKDPVKFGYMEELLFQNGIIDEDYNYVKKQGNQKILAAVYVLIFKQEYFNQYIFRNGKEKLSFTKVKAFLNFRYKANVDKEARNFMNKPQSMQPQLEKNVWLSLFFKV